MASCPSLGEGEVVRVTRVDQCGAPVAGAGNAIVSECWASVKATASLDAGQEIKKVAASGKVCGYRAACPSLLSYNLTVEFFEANPELIALLTGVPLVFDYVGNPIGWDDGVINCNTGFALELFQGIIGEDCNAQGHPETFYWLYPWLTTAQLGDLTWDNSGASFTLTASTKAGSRWYLGPWPVQAQDGSNTPGPMLTPVGASTHRRGFITTISPPTASCSTITVPADVS